MHTNTQRITQLFELISCRTITINVKTYALSLVFKDLESMKNMINELNTSLGNNTKIQEVHENFEVLRDYVSENMNDKNKVPVIEKSLFEDHLRTFNKFLQKLNPKDKKNFKRNAQEAIEALWKDQDRFNKNISMANFKF